jgi:hypothetical protein
MNQATLEQMQAISAQLARLSARELGSENSNDASTSTNHDKLPSNPETNPRVEAKAITSRN